MTLAVEYPHLQVGADGVTHIAGTRYKVRHLAAEHYAYGWSAEELLRQHPDLQPQEVYATLTYFYDHFDEMVSEIRATASVIEDSRQRQPFSREQLMQRAVKAGD